MEEKQRYQDTTLSAEERADALLHLMTVEEKFAQLQCCYVYEAEKKVTNGIGHLGTLFYEAEDAGKMVEDMERVQRHVVSSSRFGIPAIIHCEALTGAVIPQADVFQTAVGQAATWDPQSVRDMAAVAKDQFVAVGVRQALAPVMDIVRDPRWGRVGESYGEDPCLASAMSVAFVTGMQGEDLKDSVISTSKHFLAYGASEAGINMASAPVTERLLREVYAAPFQAAITEGNLQSVMNSYGTINGEPVVISKKYLHDLLRDEMEFEGMVVSDYTSIGYLPWRLHLDADMANLGEAALKAGLDVECPTPIGYGEELLEKVKAGEVDEGLVDMACRRVLTAKFKLGLFENPYPRKEMLPNVFRTERTQELCKENALKSLVLLKNDGILPLKKDVKRILVVGPHADSVRQLFGGYTWPAIAEMYADFSSGAMAGTDTAEAVSTASVDAERPYYPGSKLKCELPEVEARTRGGAPQSKSVFEALHEKYPDAEVVCLHGYNYTGDDRSELEELYEKAAGADVVIATVGGKYGWGATVTTGETMDAAHIGLPGIQEEIVGRLAKINDRLVVLHFDGRPCSSRNAQEKAAAILECWNPGMLGGYAIADVLCGDYNPGGKLPVTVAATSSQIPIYYNHENGSSYSRGAYMVDGYTDVDSAPLYYFGYGLFYTTFEYGNAGISAKEVKGSDSMTVSVDVTNIGDMAGDEVVQIYVRDVASSIARPVKQLVGFRRVSLEPGETKTVALTFRVSQLAFLDYEMNWKVEAGDMVAEVAATSNDVKAELAFKITEDALVEGKSRGFYAR